MGDKPWRFRLGAALLGILVVALTALPAAPAPAQLADGTPLCGTAQPGVTRTTADDDVLKVATFNILHSDTDDGDRSLGARLPLEAAAIAASGADVIGLQEVTRNNGFDAANEYPQKHGLVAARMASAVADATGEAWDWCWSQSNPHIPLTPDSAIGGGNPLDDLAAASGNTPDPGDFREGLAILTRFDIAATRFRHLLPRSYEAAACISPDLFCPLDAAFDSRQLLWARIAAPNGAFDMFTTHLAHGITELSPFTKLFQMQQVIDLIGQWSTTDAMPDFLVGDFNSDPTSDVLQTAGAAGFVDTYLASGGPPCAKFGDAACSGGPPDGQEVWTATATRGFSERIDYVLARPPGGCPLTVPSSGVIGDQPAQQADGRWYWPSDHLGFVSTITCNTNPIVPVAASLDGPSPRSTLPATGGSPPAGALAAVAAALGAVLLRAVTRRTS